MYSLVNYITGRNEKSSNKSKKNNIIIVDDGDSPIPNILPDEQVNIDEVEPVITVSKFNKKIYRYEKDEACNLDNDYKENMQVNTQVNNSNDSNDDNDSNDGNDGNDENDINDGNDTDTLEDEFESKFVPDNFQNYIIPESIQPYTKNAEFCRFNWNGIEFLDRWELQRKVDKTHATELAKSLKADHKKYGEFIFYDPVHIGKKKNDNNYYVLDGQHRLEAYQYFYERNVYPIQQIPAILWHAENDEHFLELFHKINSRLNIDKLKLMQYKLFEIFEGMEKKYGKNIWGINRPKINKDALAQNLRDSDSVNKLTTEEILTKIIKINDNLRKMPRASRVKPNCVASVHNSAETMDFFLGLDKTMSWIKEI
jgi:hypothetical protein